LNPASISCDALFRHAPSMARAHLPAARALVRVGKVKTVVTGWNCTERREDELAFAELDVDSFGGRDRVVANARRPRRTWRAPRSSRRCGRTARGDWVAITGMAPIAVAVTTGGARRKSGRRGRPWIRSAEKPSARRRRLRRSTGEGFITLHRDRTDTASKPRRTSLRNRRRAIRCERPTR
jgi:hypothetical protein